jgi:hypothetical protein
MGSRRMAMTKLEILHRFREKHPGYQKEINVERARRWRKENPDKTREYEFKYRKKNIREMTNSYIREIIRRGYSEKMEVSQELIDLWREILRAKRKFKEVLDGARD